jgi:hypothetical protein
MRFIGGEPKHMHFVFRTLSSLETGQIKIVQFKANLSKFMDPSTGAVVSPSPFAFPPLPSGISLSDVAASPGPLNGVSEFFALNSALQEKPKKDMKAKRDKKDKKETKDSKDKKGKKKDKMETISHADDEQLLVGGPFSANGRTTSFSAFALLNTIRHTTRASLDTRIISQFRPAT